MSEALLQTDPRKGFTSASNAQADLGCPGRHLACKGLPDDSTQYAESGTEVHAALAKRDPKGLTLEQVETYDRSVEIEAKAVEAFFGSSATLNIKVWREERLWLEVPKLSLSDPEVSHSGQPDVVYRAGKAALVADYKCGFVEVAESSKNLQLRDLAVLVQQSLIGVETVATVVIQPLATMKPEICVYNQDDLQIALHQLIARVKRSNEVGAPRVAGEVQCKYCVAKSQCREYQTFAGAMVPGMLSVLGVPVKAWTPEQRAMFMERQSVAVKWLADCKDAIKEGLMTDPEFVVGWGLKPGRKVESIKDPKVCWERCQQAGLTLQGFMDCINVGKTSLKEVLHEGCGLKGKALNEAMARITDGIVDVREDAPTIVRKESE